MYDVGLSALVLKICSDYSQSLGLNFPPNVQQEINAIAQWVDTHTVKDISFTQDGNVVTVTATTQNNSSQSWVFTLPDISVDKLYTMIKGSNGINVDYSEDRNSLVISLDKKYYLHNITCSGPSGSTLYDIQIKAITDSKTPYTYDTYNSLSVYKQAICVQFGFTDSSSNYHYYPTGSLKSAGGITYYEGTTLKNFSMYSISHRFVDTVTEL